MEEMFTVQELAANLKVSVETVYRWIDHGRGELEALRAGGKWRVTASALERFLSRRKQNGGGLK